MGNTEYQLAKRSYTHSNAGAGAEPVVEMYRKIVGTVVSLSIGQLFL